MGLAIVDTSVVLLLVKPPSKYIEGEEARAKNANAYIDWLDSKLTDYMITAPGFMELAKPRELSGEDLLALIAPRLARLRVADFDYEAAKCGATLYTSAQIRKEAHKSEQQTESRHLLKFDLQIAAIAHSLGATYLVHANSTDFRRYLSDLTSTVKALRIDTEAVPNEKPASKPPPPLPLFPESGGAS